MSGHPAGDVCIQPCLAELVVGSEIARDRDCDLGQLTDRVWLSSGQRIRKTNHYNHYSDLRESDWEVDYYLRMRRAASPRAKVGRRGPRALLDARAAIHIIYVIYIRGRRGRAHPPSNYVIYPRAARAAGLLKGFPYQETTRRTKDPGPPRKQILPVANRTHGMR